jgi:hypothetical protein
LPSSRRESVAEIKLSDGTLLKTLKSVAEHNAERIGERSGFVRLDDNQGQEWYVNVEQIVYMRDNTDDSGPLS